jgi:hypothetical protein
MLGRRQMVAVYNPAAIAGQPWLQRSAQGIDHRGGLLGRVADQGGRHRCFDAIEFVVNRRQRESRVALFQRLKGGVDAGLDSQDHIAHQVNQRRKVHFARVASSGGLGEKVIDPLGIEYPFQNGACHHAHRTLFDERFKHLCQTHDYRLRADCPESHWWAKVPNTRPCWKGCP